MRRRPVHGRWPKVAAVAAPLTTAAWVAARPRLDRAEQWRWAAWPVLLWHQVEEWVWPAAGHQLAGLLAGLGSSAGLMAALRRRVPSGAAGTRRARSRRASS